MNRIDHAKNYGNHGESVCTPQRSRQARFTGKKVMV